MQPTKGHEVNHHDAWIAVQDACILILPGRLERMNGMKDEIIHLKLEPFPRSRVQGRVRWAFNLVFSCGMIAIGSIGCNPISKSGQKTAGENISTIPDERDRQVLEAMMLHVLAVRNVPEIEKDSALAFFRHGREGKTILMHPSTPEGSTIYLSHSQIARDLHDFTLSQDIEDHLRHRNTSVKSKRGRDESVETTYTGLKFAPEIVVTDLTEIWKAGVFLADTHPDALCWIEHYLPGYSSDGNEAVVRSFIGPTAHGATITACLVKSNNKWVVKWFRIARYA